jgi:putative inorganic carbon (hco3(-)) transporter
MNMDSAQQSVWKSELSTPMAAPGAAEPTPMARATSITATRYVEHLLKQVLFMALVILACATPLTYWPKWSWACFPFYDVTFGVVLSLFAVSLLVPKPAIPRLNRLDLVLALFVVWVGANALTKGSWPAAKPLIELSLLAFIVEHASFSTGQSKRLLLALMLTGTIVAGLGIYEFIFEHKLKVTVTLLNPNHFSGYLCLLLPMSLCLWRTESPWGRVLAVLITTTLAFGTAVSLTRGGYLAALIGMSGFALMKDKRLLLVIALYFICFGYLALEARTRRSAAEFSTKQLQGAPVKDNVTARIYLWRFAWQQFETAPLSGVGIGNYRARLSKYLESNPQARQWYPEILEPHNSYLKVLCELGLPGLVLFLGVLACWIWEGGKALFLLNSHQVSAWGLGVFWGSVSFLVHNLTNTLFIVIPCALGFWLALGILRGSTEQGELG